MLECKTQCKDADQDPELASRSGHPRRGMGVSSRRSKTGIVSLICLIALCIAPHGLGAREDFESFRKRRLEAAKEFSETLTQSCKEYREEIRRAFSEYREKAAEVWGGDNAALPDRKRWVSHRDGMRERNEVFRYLVRNLPYEETRNSIRKVRRKMPKYRRM